MNVASPADAFRLLGDGLRLRILRLLAHERLNVGELTEALDVGQSTVSRHVRLLREGSLLEETREAGYTWLALAVEAPPGLHTIWPTLRAGFGEALDDAGDDARLAAVLRAREEREIGWGGRRPHPRPGRSWAAWARALGHLLPPLDVVDLGCGEGALTREVARWARHVDGVDASASSLAAAQGEATRRGVANVRWIEAPLDATGLDAERYDVVLLSQALHLEDDPAGVVREGVRLLKNGGRLLVLDLMEHEEGWVRDRWGHRHLGFGADTIRAWMGQAGLAGVRLEDAARRRGHPFTVLVASGVKQETRPV